MQIQIDNYTFDHIAGTVTFSDYVSIRLDSIMSIVNVTHNIIMYIPTESTNKLYLLGGTVLDNVITLNYDTTEIMSDSDSLQIFYDDRDAVSRVSATAIADITRMNNIGNSVATQQSALYVQLYGQERMNWSQCVRNRIT